MFGGAVRHTMHVYIALHLFILLCNKYVGLLGKTNLIRTEGYSIVLSRFTVCLSIGLGKFSVRIVLVK